MPEAAAIAGWYGKIASMGDFAGRRLSQEFINTWDAWLQHGLTASRASLGSRWLDVYLTSPIWRFTLLPGVIGNKTWLGIIMPSVDKVGRYFPLTIALGLDDKPEVFTSAFTAHAWYAALEKIALATLDVEFRPEQLDAELGGAPFPASHDRQELATGRCLADWWQGLSPSCISTLPALSLLPSVLLGATVGPSRSLWWSGSGEDEPARFYGFTGLPPEDYVADMLQGHAPAA
jgi:type VI secretion system protein ImpM